MSYVRGGGVRCKPCANNAVAEQDQQQSFLRAYHEVKNTHVWVASREACDLCGAGPCDCGSKRCDECRAGVQTKQCDETQHCVCKIELLSPFPGVRR